MLSRLACCLAVLMSLSLTGSVFAQQRVTLKPNFQAGQDLVYVLSMRLGVEQMIVDEELQQWVLLCGATLVMQIDSVESDGSIKATGSFKRGNVRLTEGDVVKGFSWGADAGADPRWGASAALAEPLSQAKFSIEVDQHGQATITKGLEAVIEKYIEVGEGDERVMGFFTPEKLGETITPIFALDEVGVEPMTAGREWQSHDVTTLPGAGDLRMTVSFILDRVDPNEAEYTGLPLFFLAPPAPGRNPDAPEVRLIHGAGGVSGFFDFNARMLRQRKQTTQIHTQWRQGDVQIIMKQEATTYLQLGEGRR